MFFGLRLGGHEASMFPAFHAGVCISTPTGKKNQINFVKLVHWFFWLPWGFFQIQINYNNNNFIDNYAN